MTNLLSETTRREFERAKRAGARPLLRCWFGFHPWGRWGPTFVVAQLDNYGLVAGHAVMQQRSCPACGIVRQRNV